MATELMKNWIVELHNPDRVQTKGYLGREDRNGQRSNCCLGVLCEVNGIEPDVRKDEYDDTEFSTLYYDGYSGIPGVPVLEVLFADRERGDYVESVALYEEEVDDWNGNPINRTITADVANDEKDLTFVEIAEKLSERYLSREEKFEVRKAVEDKGWA